MGKKVKKKKQESRASLLSSSAVGSRFSYALSAYQSAICTVREKRSQGTLRGGAINGSSGDGPTPFKIPSLQAGGRARSPTNGPKKKGQETRKQTKYLQNRGFLAQAVQCSSRATSYLTQEKALRRPMEGGKEVLPGILREKNVQYRRGRGAAKT